MIIGNTYEFEFAGTKYKGKYLGEFENHGVKMHKYKTTEGWVLNIKI